MKKIAFIVLALLATGFTQDSKTVYVKNHISNLKDGVLLVRLHEHLGAQKKMLELKHYVSLEGKKMEVAKKNNGMIKAFKDHYDFSLVYFFYARHTDEIVAKNYKEFVFDSNRVKVDVNMIGSKNVYILDGEQVYFEHFGQDSEGYAVYDDSLRLLEKPFPFYVRKRSGTLIVKRTEPEMVIKLQEELDKTFKKFVTDQRAY